MQNYYGILVASKRKEKGYCQMQLFKETGIAMSTISTIENGVRIPQLNTFTKLNEALGITEITYEELLLRNCIENNRIEEDLLTAMENGRGEELQRKIDHFRNIADKSSVEHQQYLDMGSLIYMKKMGMETEDFIEKCIAIFEKRRELPDFDELESQSIDKIEHLMLYKIGMANLEIGNLDISRQILAGLFKNSFNAGTDYFNKRCKNLSASYALILIKDNRDKDAEECIRYIFERVFESFDTRMFFQSLTLKAELYKRSGNNEGEELINKFLLASEALANYLYMENRGHH